jgi:predicted Zn-dependent protease
MIVIKRICTAGFLCLFLLSAIMAPNAMGITVQQEEKLSREFMEEVRRQFKFVDDPYIDKYVNDIGQKLLKEFPPQPFTLHFYVVEQDVYNAFAGPAGNIFVYTGLIEAMDNEEELAGILGHEISHVACRHISQNVERAGKIQIGTLAGLLAGILLGASGASGSATSAVAIGSIAAGQSVFLAYSREDERQADEVGIKALIGAGYPVEGLITMLKKIKAKDWYGDEVPSYLGTHPGVEERIVYLSRFIDSGAEPVSLPKVPEDTFNRVHARLLAFYGNPEKAAIQFKAMAEKTPESFLPDYGMGLLASRQGNLKKANAYFRKALEKNAFDPYLLVDLGQNYMQEGDYPAALKILESAVSMDPKNLEGRLFLGQTQLALGDFREAQSILERVLVDDPNYSKALKSLGETFDKQGRTAEALYYLGLSYLKANDIKKAVFNLKRAQKEATDEGLQKKIEEALKTAEEETKKGKKRKDRPEDDGDKSQNRDKSIKLSTDKHYMITY